MSTVYSNVLNTREKTRQAKKKVTPQNIVIPGREKEMTKNSDGNFVFTVDKWGQVLRFLILGTEGPTFYSSEIKHTVQATKAVIAAAKEDGIRLVDLIVEVSEKGRGIKNDPALLALAVVMTHGNTEARQYAAEAFPKVARIGTHVLHLADYLNGMRSWNRQVRRGFSNIYNGWNAYGLALNVVKYANRDGWTHKDVLRLAHVRPSTPDHDAILYRVSKPDAEVVKTIEDTGTRRFLEGVAQIKTATNAKVAAQLISDYRLPREVVPTELLNSQEVWEALLPHMGLEATLRNLATMTRVGVISSLSGGTKVILGKFEDEEQIVKSKLHPFKVLTALLTYQQGHGIRGGNVWTPNRNIVDGLEELFPKTFKNVVPTGKRILFALDVSPSMHGGVVGGVPGLTPAIASAALLSVHMRTEKLFEATAFSSGGYSRYAARMMHDDVSGIVSLNVGKNSDIGQIVKAGQKVNWGGTNISLPMEYARVKGLEVDAFVIMTDNETNSGHMGARHPSQALTAYRQSSGIPAKMAVISMVANKFSVADPKDNGQMDFVGFDSNGPSILADFIRGDL